MRSRELALVALIALLVALVWTWPLAADLTGSLPHDARFTVPAGSDVHEYVWNLWWARTAVERAHDPFWCDRIWWPHGHGLALHTHAMAWGLVSVPFQWALGLPAALNLTVLLLFAAAAAATYALARALELSRPAAALAAFAWSFSPYFLQKSLEHLSYTASPWPPLLALSFLRWMNASGPVYARERWRAALATGAVAGLLLWTDPVASLYAFLLPVALASFAPPCAGGSASEPIPMGEKSTRGGLASPAAWMAAVAAGVAIGLPYLVDLIRELGEVATGGPAAAAAAAAGTGDAGAVVAAGLGREQLYHPRLLDFVTPSGLNGLWRGHDSGAPIEGASWPGRRPEVSGLYLGLSVLVLALVAARGARGARAAPAARGARRWVAVAIALLVLTWDPGPDPEGWLSGAYRRLPPLDVLRVPARLFPIAFLPLCLAAGMGLDILLRARRTPLAIAAGALLAIEFSTARYTTMRFEVPEAVLAIAAEPAGVDGGAVCVLPFAGGAHVSMSWQTVHQRPVSWSYVARTSTALIEELSRTLPDLFALASGARWPEPEALGRDLEQAKVEHVLAREAEIQEPEKLAALLEAVPGWVREPTYDGVLWWRRELAQTAAHAESEHGLRK